MDQEQKNGAPDGLDNRPAAHQPADTRRAAIAGHGKRLFAGARGRAQAGYAMAQARLRDRPRAEQLLLIGLWSLAAGLMAFLLYLVILIPLTPGIADLRQASTARPSVILSADGKELGSFEKGLQERVKLSQISPHVLKALISTEDHRFYDHHGVDFRRVAGAMLATLKGDPQGGSTITQQLSLIHI